mgnify:CR=1 FL=1
MYVTDGVLTALLYDWLIPFILVPNGNVYSIDYTKQQSIQNYELHELHEDRGNRRYSFFNIRRQNDRMYSLLMFLDRMT